MSSNNNSTFQYIFIFSKHFGSSVIVPSHATQDNAMPGDTLVLSAAMLLNIKRGCLSPTLDYVLHLCMARWCKMWILICISAKQFKMQIDIMTCRKVESIATSNKTGDVLWKTGLQILTWLFSYNPVWMNIINILKCYLINMLALALPCIGDLVLRYQHSIRIGLCR